MSSRPIGAAGRRAVVAAAASAAVASLLFTAGPASAAPATGALPAPDYQGLRQAVNGVVAAGSPGVFAQVSDRGGAGGTVSAGTGDLTTQAPVDPQGQFRVGSITKNFTAVLVLQLVARHQVDLDAPAAGYLPSGVLPADSPITVRQLLDHTSGLYDYTNDLPGILVGDTVTGYQQFRYATYDPADLVADALTHGSQFTPGSRYQYSNTNFVVLGMLVEHVTAEPFAQVLNERILWPAGMKDTRFVVPRTGIGGPHAVGYLTEDDRSKPLFDATEQTGSWIWTAGAAISGTADLNRYWRALTGGRLLPPEQLAEMETMQPADATGTSFYGLGLRAYTLSCGIQVYGHDGIVQGYQTYSYTTADGSRQVTVSANASNNSAVFAAERATLDPVFCGAPAAPAAARVAATASVHVAREETTGVSPEPLTR
ncbi:serine hydrolase domain-containing protein [Actinacidiphila acididurans]|uniref:Beta-lactamase family protein n=1 Tax=Actinacidiphila acididurans TaxID=2784346 RepID=A0ABS2U534_9ACTN|nr:serine hydrolase domain-containing protein [Actinacidiphila acididurans]MBM9510720.1 beta-lactamase family protein [Actinacidiphila acididurans]